MTNEGWPDAADHSSLVTRHSSLVLTVTPNTGLDRVLFLDRLSPGRNAARVVWAMGGKGCDVSLILRGLAVPTVATGFAAGDIGHRMEEMLAAAGVRCAFIATQGETRINTVLIEEATGTHTTVCAESLQVTAEHAAALVSLVEREAASAQLAVLAGSLPEGVSPDLYPRLIAVLHRAGIPIVLDATEPYLGAALGAGVDAVKPNRAELARWVEEPLPDVAAAAEAARRMREAGAGTVLASLDRDGMLLAAEEATWYAPPLEIAVKNPAGAGDGAVAGFCHALLRGAPPPEQLESAVRVASAVCLTPGTAEFHAEDLASLPPVEIQRLA
jgi:1-phosphofructokinase family hexose kinase